MKATKHSLEESQSTALKNRMMTQEYGNISTTRVNFFVIRQKESKTPFQFKTLHTEDNESDTYRSQQAFRKLKNLEFKNDIYLMDMQHAQRRKEVEESRMQLQLCSIKSDIDFMKSQLQSPVLKTHSRKKSQSSDSEKSSDYSSDSSNENSFVKLKCPIKFKSNEFTATEHREIKSYEEIQNKFRKLFSISDVNDRFNLMVKQYFNSLHSVQMDLQNNLIPYLLENALKLLIDLIEKLNSIKLDSLHYKSYDPLADKNTKGYSSELEIDASSPDFQLQGQSIMNYCQKLTEQPQKSQFNTPQYIKTQTNEQPSARQLQSMMKQSKPESSCQTSNNQTLDKKVSISERSMKKSTQKCQLMPSLKNRQK